MFTMLVKFSFPGEIIYHKEYYFETKEELEEFRVRVDNCPYTEAVKVDFVNGDMYLPF